MNRLNNQAVYYLLNQGIEAERTIYQAHLQIGDESKANISYKRILQGERVLSLIRSNRLRSEPIYQ